MKITAVKIKNKGVYVKGSHDNGTSFWYYLNWKGLWHIVRAFADVEESKRFSKVSKFLGWKMIAKLVKYAAGRKLTWEKSAERTGIKKL